MQGGARQRGKMDSLIAHQDVFQIDFGNTNWVRTESLSSSIYFPIGK